ncbi:HAD family hydrolase [Aureispira anguillae]|uniref:HAD family phosphatase n=1 Tax=Aureispira anguillae TaxID=2864201 RepID=A0A916DWJ4_9BACT|nr:HAD family phosphatase [Aureispira anguillae]BDS14096.1 HAD family phosphatase [Aureispira anguillae]
MKGIKNIIFDLGGVLIHLQPAYTEAAFCALVGDKKEFQRISKILIQAGVFDDFETGKLTEEAFIHALKEHNSNPVTRAQLETAWNAMLLNIPSNGLELLEELKAKGYRVYLLSNTNSIHLREFRQIVAKEHGIEDFDALFDKAYYSHLINERKPDEAAFQYVLDDAQLIASETLFIDDNAPNLVGARAAGIHTLLHPANSDIKAHLKLFLQVV